ncbi:MAG TPA: formate dehydrogenase accessory protein FdhE [Caulobacteraceae bacterium]|jgi:FdhE protein|nr:formate dehydrogenase accessory protein FdhE [Caulobacteraceae bacterium]
MRQGGAPPTGKWIGNATDGVKAPEPIKLPDAAARFSTTARRLEALASGHPMADWLAFMAQLSWAQHEAATTLPAPPTPSGALIERSVRAGMPPLSADGHQRDPAWRDALARILDQFENVPIPGRAAAAIDDLKRQGALELEALADAFLSGVIDDRQVGHALYVAAALQVYFTRLAQGLDVEALRLLPERGLCPCCGSTPVAGLVTASGRTPGVRYLYCSLCSTAWNHVRVVCITCGGSASLSLESIEGDNGAIRAETCGDCGSYAKLLYQAKEAGLDPYADDLASLALDVLVAEAGWHRHAPNPLLLAG